MACARRGFAGDARWPARDAASRAAAGADAPASAGAFDQPDDGTTAAAGPALPQTPPAASGPQPLRQDDAAKLAGAEAHLSAGDGVWRDLLELSARERQDAGARRLEQMLAQSILRHGGQFTRLRLASPQCTRSVCLIRGVGAGQTRDPRSDWQGLAQKIMNEPWFREAFDDARTSVGGAGDETVYVTLFVRCEPGTCRLARR